jgi:hypothetical protein
MPVKKKPGEKIYEDDPRYEQDKFEGAVRTWRDRLKRTAPEGGVAPRPEKKVKDDTNPPPRITRTGHISPGEWVPEDDPRYPKAQILRNVKRWKSQGAEEERDEPGTGTRTYPDPRVKDDVYTPPTKTVADAAQKFKDRKAPPLLPIYPTVGPTQIAKQATGIHYGFTPEAQEMLHKTPVEMRPPIEGDNRGGGYFPDSGKIDIIGAPSRSRSPAQGVLAHELGHKWWFTKLTPDEQQRYMSDHNQWADTGAWDNLGKRATDQFNVDQETSGLYDNDAASRPTETHARVIQFAPLDDMKKIPAYMRPYYRGLFQDVPNPRPTENPDPNGQFAQWNSQPGGVPDASGNYGAPPVQQWKNYW